MVEVEVVVVWLPMLPQQKRSLTMHRCCFMLKTMARLASHIKDESSKNMTRDFPKSSCKLLDAAVAAVEEEVEVEVESKTSFELQGRTTRKRGAPTERI